MDITTLLAGGGLVAAGMVLQRLIPARKPRPGYKPAEAICGCRHHLSYHEDGTGRCSFESNWANCTCRHYVGPAPLPELYAEGYTTE